MLAPYITVLRRPGALAFSAAALVGRLPMSMVGIGIVLLVSITEGTYALAGILASVCALAAALASPLLSRLADRIGQAPVLLLFSTTHTLLLLGFVAAVRASEPVWLLVLLAAAAGAAEPAFGSLVRARWSALLAGTPEVGVAFALESVLDEIVYIVGPVITTALAVGVSPGAGLLTAAILTLIGGVSLGVQRRTQPRPSGAEGRRGSRPRLGLAVPVMWLVFACVGMAFGGLEVSVVAFCTERGVAAQSGAVLAVFAGASAVSGLLVGPRVAERDLPRLLLVLLVVSAAVTALLPFASTVWAVGLLGVAVGVFMSPTLICGFTIVENTVPTSRLTESISWLGAGIGVGFALASGVAGVVIDAHGPSTGFLVMLAGSVLAAVASAATLRALHRTWLTRPHAMDPAIPDLTG